MGTDDEWKPPPHSTPPRSTGTKRIVVIALCWLAVAGVIAFAVVMRVGRESARADVARLENEHKDLTNALELHRGKGLDLEGNLTKCKENLTTLSDVDVQKSSLETELGACRSNVQGLQGEAAEAKRMVTEFKAVTGKFQKMIDSGKLDVVFRRGQMVVKLPAAILFPSGSSKISEQGTPAIREVAGILKQMPGRRFTVAGHTDSVALGPKDEYSSNWELSTARAVRITELLIDSGVPAASLVAAGHSNFDPIAPNTTASGRQKNRRIEIILAPELKAVATPAVKTSAKTAAAKPTAAKATTAKTTTAKPTAKKK